jgi:hypothetical protein
MTASASPGKRPERSAAHRFVLRGARSALLGVAIALVFSFGFDQRLTHALAYSVPISLGCWFFIDSGRLLAARWVHRGAALPRAQWPGWPWMAATIVLGTLLGYSVVRRAVGA